MPQLTVLDIDGIGWVAYRLEELWDLKKEKKIIIPWLYFAWPTEKLPQLLNLLISYLNAKNNFNVEKENNNIKARVATYVRVCLLYSDYYAMTPNLIENTKKPKILLHQKKLLWISRNGPYLLEQ